MFRAIWRNEYPCLARISFSRVFTLNVDLSHNMWRWALSFPGRWDYLQNHWQETLNKSNSGHFRMASTSESSFFTHMFLPFRRVCFCCASMILCPDRRSPREERGLEVVRHPPKNLRLTNSPRALLSAWEATRTDLRTSKVLTFLFKRH